MIGTITLEKHHDGEEAFWCYNHSPVVCEKWGEILGFGEKVEMEISDVEVEGFTKAVSHYDENCGFRPLDLGEHEIEDHFIHTIRRLVEKVTGTTSFNFDAFTFWVKW